MRRRARIRPGRSMSMLAAIAGMAILIFGLSFIGNSPFMLLWIAVVAGIIIFYLANAARDYGAATMILEHDAGRTAETQSDVAGRLRELLRLKDEGLIAEDEFERKRREILDAL